MISLLGIPYDGSSTFMQGASGAPDLIRNAIQSPSANLAIENGMSFDLSHNVIDLGNLDFADLDISTQAGVPPSDAVDKEIRRRIEDGVQNALEVGRPLLSLGGDHSVTFPIMNAIAPRYKRLTIVQFDAHPDLYNDFEGYRYSHACPFSRILESYDHVDLVQIGIRTMNEHCRLQAEKFGVTVYEMSNLPSSSELVFEGPVYVSLDLDALDPAFAPGISHHEPGGMSTRELIETIRMINANVIGADLVEFNPVRDSNGVTAMVAAKLTKELAGKLMESAFNSRN